MTEIFGKIFGFQIILKKVNFWVFNFMFFSRYNQRQYKNNETSLLTFLISYDMTRSFFLFNFFWAAFINFFIIAIIYFFNYHPIFKRQILKAFYSQYFNTCNFNYVLDMFQPSSGAVQIEICILLYFKSSWFKFFEPLKKRLKKCCLDIFGMFCMESLCMLRE